MEIWKQIGSLKDECRKLRTLIFEAKLYQHEPNSDSKANNGDGNNVDDGCSAKVRESTIMIETFYQGKI